MLILNQIYKIENKMENTPKELEESQLNLKVVIDPKNQCLTTNTEDYNPIGTKDTIPSDILTNHDPLIQPKLEEMNELDRLIWEERARLLNINIHKSEPIKITKSNVPSYLWSRNKRKIKARLRREQETPEEHEYKTFRARIGNIKQTLLKKLKNFDDETILKKITKRPRRTHHKNTDSIKTHLAYLRRNVFRTPEDMLAKKEKNKEYRERYLSKFSQEERRAIEKASRERVKERQKEWKKFDMIIKGLKPVEDTDEADEVEEQLVVRENAQKMIEEDVGGLVVENILLDNIPVKSEIIDSI